MHIGQLGSGGNQLRGLVIHAEADVVGDGVGEQEIVLRYISAAGANIPDGHGVHIVTVNKQRAVGHIVSTQNQIHQRGFAGAGLAHKTHILAGLDGKGQMLQHIELTVGITERKIAEFNVTADLRQCFRAGAVYHILLCVQQLGNTLDGSLAPGGQVNQLGHGHNGPCDGIEIDNVFRQLTGVEFAHIYQIAAVSQNHANHAFHKQADHHAEGDGSFGKGDVGFFVFLIKLFEEQQLLGFFYKSLDNRNAGKTFLGKIRQVGEGLLAGIPFFCQVLAYDNGGC